MRAVDLLCGIGVVTLLLSGCAKTPATAVAAAPAPTGGAKTVAEPVRDTTPPSNLRQPAGTSTGGDRTTASSQRPSPSEFVSVGDLPDIHFDFDRYAVRPDDARILDGHARWLKANARDLLLIEGHCDERGTNEYNLALGDRRANAAMQYLIAQGINAGRITTVSYGKERPQCTERNEACWAKNRRAHFLVKHE